jgi:hypothetical protein
MNAKLKAKIEALMVQIEYEREVGYNDMDLYELEDQLETIVDSYLAEGFISGEVLA